MEQEITNIGRTIYSTLKDLVDNRVYPLVAEQTTNFPFIIYRTTASRPEHEKDRMWGGWDFHITIDVVDDSYDNVVKICDDALELLYALESDYVLEIESISENWQDNAYIRELEVCIKK